jgi:hypothetical protein
LFSLDLKSSKKRYPKYNFTMDWKKSYIQRQKLGNWYNCKKNNRLDFKL